MENPNETTIKELVVENPATMSTEPVTAPEPVINTPSNIYTDQSVIGNLGNDGQSDDDRKEPINTEAEPVTASEVIERRKRGRPRKNTAESATTTIPENAPEIRIESSAQSDNQPITSTVDYAACSALTVAMGTSTLAMILGEEWQCEDDNERTQLTIAVAKYMEAKKMEDIPPGALLAITLITYSAKRFRKPNTREKVKNGWLWIKSKFSRKKNFQPKLVQ